MSTLPDIQRLFDLQKLLHQFHTIERQVHLPGEPIRPESDTEHTYTLTMSAWFLAQYFPELDTNTCIRLALVHDLVEIYAGDTFAYATGKPQASKSDREEAALKKIAGEWQDFPELVEAIEGYEALATPESCFVYALDKLMPPIIVFMGQGHSWKAHKITFEKLLGNKSSKIQKSPQVLTYFNQLVKLMQQNPDYFHQEESG
jgi:putative hydrolases of HD superfamily